MGSIDDVDRLLRRAKRFRRDAVAAYNEGYYDVACFYAEQAVQLKIKAYILRNLGFMPRIHVIRELLSIEYTSIIEMKGLGGLLRRGGVL